MYAIKFYVYKNAVLALAKAQNSDFNSSLAIVADTQEKAALRLQEEGRSGVTDTHQVNEDFVLPVFASQFPGKIIDTRPNPALVVAKSSFEWIECPEPGDEDHVETNEVEFGEGVVFDRETGLDKVGFLSEVGGTEMVETGSVELIDDASPEAAELAASTIIVSQDQLETHLDVAEEPTEDQATDLVEEADASSGDEPKKSRVKKKGR